MTHHRPVRALLTAVFLAGVPLASSACGAARSTEPVEVDLTAPATPASTGEESASPAAPAPPEGGVGTYEIYPGVSVAEAWVDCRTEDDCAIVEAGCCDHCNGGAITTVNRAFAEQARTRLAKVGCERPCSTHPCDSAQGHQLVCMTRACHFEDLEEEVRARIWGQASPEPDGADVLNHGSVGP